MSRQVSIADVEIDTLAWEESLDKVILSMRQDAVRVFFVNAHCVNIANEDKTYHLALDRAEFVFNDGAGVEIASRLLGHKITDNLDGTDWIPALFDRLQTAGDPLKLYLLGARPPIVEAAAAAIPLRWPTLEIVGWQNGYFIDAQAVLADIERTRPNILLVAMGVPKQELFIDQHWQSLKIPSLQLAIAGGAILDFVTGAVPRSPLWMQRGRIEWLYRLWNEPRRLWKRYLWGNINFFYLVVKQWLRKK